MSDTATRLASCFAAVFPELSQEEIPRAATASRRNWDSLATASLVAVVEEEFAVEVSPDDLDQFISFASICQYLEEQAA